MAFVQSEVEDFLGRGITLPLRLENGSIPLDSGPTLIKASIRMILAWAFGTRFFLAEFGSRVENLIEEPNDDVLLNIAHALVAEAIEKWEPRVEFIDVELERPDFNKLSLRIIYRVISSQQTDTFVYPFYPEITT
jgi:phage baseplate assembly protein W